MMKEKHRAVVYIPDVVMHKVFTHGVVLPEGYELVTGVLNRSPERLSWVLVVQSYDIPPSGLGEMLPECHAEDIGTHIRVLPIGEL